MENTKFLFQLYFRPAAAMSEIIDKGSWVSAAVLMLFVSFAFQYAVNSRIAQTFSVSKSDYYLTNSSFDGADSINGKMTPAQREEAEYYADLNIEKEMRRERRPLPLVGKSGLYFVSFEENFFTPIISLSVLYVPALILLMSLFGGVGSFSVILQRSYGETATCALMAWAAAHLPSAIAGFALNSANIDGAVYLLLWLAGVILFGVLMLFALRTVFGANFGTAILVVSVSSLAFSAGMYLFNFISPWLFSPFLLFYGYLYFGGAISGELRGVGGAFRGRQNFKRFLHNATVNPNDADAHVQLALIYLQRRQEEKALEHLEKAVAIDKNEIDANYELGRLARKNGDLQKALNHFGIVVEENEKYALSEIWREIGATYQEAGMLGEAREALEKFVTRRPVDSEGLYRLGKVYQLQNEPEKAREMFEQSIQSAKTSPDYRRRELRHWSKLAEKEI